MPNLFARAVASQKERARQTRRALLSARHAELRPFRLKGEPSATFPAPYVPDTIVGENFSTLLAAWGVYLLFGTGARGWAKYIRLPIWLVSSVFVFIDYLMRTHPFYYGSKVLLRLVAIGAGVKFLVFGIE